MIKSGCSEIPNNHSGAKYNSHTLHQTPSLIDWFMKSHRLYPPQPVFLHRLNVETSYSFNKSSIGSTHLLRVTTQKCNTTKSHYISRRNSGTYTPKNKILLIELIEPLWNYLQQQKLLELTSRQPDSQGYRAIYNSRNYQSLLALRNVRAVVDHIYNSRNYQSLLAVTSGE